MRSSIARRLGVDVGAIAPVDRHVEGVVEMVLDATSRSAEPLTAQRLFGWHAAMFPTGCSGVSKLTVGQWRDDAAGPMQVVSGPVGRRKVHFQAPPADTLPAETARFLAWANEDTGEPALIKAGLAHLCVLVKAASRASSPAASGRGIAKCSPDTALRDITQLLELGVLKKSPGGGRSTGYELEGQ